MRSENGRIRRQAYLSFGAVIRPLPSHCVQRGGYILCPGFAACFTSEKPVPLHASHFRSDEGDLFLILMPQKPSVCPTWPERRLVCNLVNSRNYGFRSQGAAFVRRSARTSASLNLVVGLGGLARSQDKALTALERGQLRRAGHLWTTKFIRDSWRSERVMV